MNEHAETSWEGERLAPEGSIENNLVTETPHDTPPTPAVDPARSAAGRRGAERFHELVRLGREYEREHGLQAGRQRLKQLVQLGKRYEQEHGLAVAKPRRKRRGDAWAEFLTALARVTKPAHRASVEQLASSLRSRAPRSDAA